MSDEGRQTRETMTNDHESPAHAHDTSEHIDSPGHEGRTVDPIDWDARYSSADQMWSGDPNGSLVAEVASLAPGTALDVGCGEGADAIWLSGLGWSVTAIDVSEVGLDRARQAARRAGAEVKWLHAGLLDAALPVEGFDLVSVQYPALPHAAMQTTERSLLAAVGIGGHLVLVHHADIDHDVAKAHGFDPSHYVSFEDISSLIDDDWDVIVDERRPRHVTEGAGAGHTHDVVLHAVRIR